MLHFPKKLFRWDCMLKLLSVSLNQLAAFPLVGFICTMWTPFSIFSFEYNYFVSENHGLCFVTKNQKTAMGLIYEIYHWSLSCLFPVSDESQMYMDYWLFLTYSFWFLDLYFLSAHWVWYYDQIIYHFVSGHKCCKWLPSSKNKKKLTWYL